MEARAARRDVAIHGLLDGRKRWDPIGRREHAPSSAKLVQSAVDRGRAFELAAPHINGPGGPVGLVAGQAVALEDAGLLVGDDQHTAGPVAPANPARKPRSNASSAVEQRTSSSAMATRLTQDG